MDFAAIQESINKIEGVILSKVVEEKGEITEIHVLANNNKSAKQIVRDIESALYVIHNYKIDRNKISVASVQGEELLNKEKRVKFSSVELKNKLNKVECIVTLFYDDKEYTVEEVAINTTLNRKKIVLKATLKAVEEILCLDNIFDGQEVIINNNGGISVVTVIVITLLSGKEEALVGSALVKNDVYEAIARAALDAVNRVILMTTK
ncbi:hypothetical protein SAMN02745227_01709 [Anaerobranca californiensis DSM 14826]|jgi:hypothetical protein|uniref:Uncharacterized protein n=1 Tax=Anaerobranca californiensis DSM 14826 TaxID=1120989 RepID=A0A1M6QBE9_9FIRM|nr:hypothetical protein [Anaerobranca californiensis]SHK17486.1 hypothetical protein SAMN02745227_01709 [Anaerobranca californiensis DSM 14826]